MAESIMGKPEHINVLIIRSGQSEWDRTGRLAGQADLPLCEQSKLELQDASSLLDGAELSAILHAGDQCSKSTAEAYARVTGGKSKTIDAIADIDLGLWEGLRWEDLEDKAPKAFREWKENPANVSVPEGESLNEAYSRISLALAKAIEKLRAPDPGVGVVLRPMAYGLVRCWLTGRPVSELWEIMEGPSAEWHELSRAQLKQTRELSRVGS
ncbi:MAG: histidine phosphatase family protein [Phycisphaera sp.]|nr:MAG: histidine phosphatase family protein [Phycisphaera sp.]